MRGCVKRPGKGNGEKRCYELAWRGAQQRRVSGGKIKEKEKEGKETDTRKKRKEGET
jgi:hypothetical protein